MIKMMEKVSSFIQGKKNNELWKFQRCKFYQRVFPWIQTRLSLHNDNCEIYTPLMVSFTIVFAPRDVQIYNFSQRLTMIIVGVTTEREFAEFPLCPGERGEYARVSHFWSSNHTKRPKGKARRSLDMCLYTRERMHEETECRSDCLLGWHVAPWFPRFSHCSHRDKTKRLSVSGITERNYTP